MIINDNYETITCRICGEQCRRLCGSHIERKHKITSKEYKIMFPGAPISSQSYLENTLPKNGKHMKDDKYKKMFSEKIKGDKNPNHKSKTTKEERQNRSPFSKKFSKYKGTDDEINEMVNNFTINATKDRVNNTCIEYYLNKGYDLETSKEMLKKRQRTFTLEKCIEKYGEENGYEIYTLRQEKWQNSLNENGNMKNGFSLISQTLFDEISKRIEGEFKYASNGGELKLRKKDGGVWMYDFTDIERKKIIEYHGDIYHGNPNIYSDNDNPNPFKKNLTAKEIWENDNKKLEIANNEGYEVFYIWDSEFNKVDIEEKNKIIEKCIQFLIK